MRFFEGWKAERMIHDEQIPKLEARYPNGFEAERSLHRAEGDV